MWHNRERVNIIKIYPTNSFEEIFKLLNEKLNEKGIDIDSVSVSPFAGANKKEEKIKQMNVNRPFFFGITHSELGDRFLFMCKIEQIN